MTKGKKEILFNQIDIRPGYAGTPIARTLRAIFVDSALVADRFFDKMVRKVTKKR